MQTARVVPQDLTLLAESCSRMGSRFFAALLERAAAAYEDDEPLRALLDRHAHRSRIGLRLGGAAHFRALRGSAPSIATHYPSTGGDGDPEAAWDAVLADIHANAAAYDELFQREIQTNEVARALPVLAGMLLVAHSTGLGLRVFEIGASAGLLLNFDRYRYVGDGWTWGDPRSPLHLQNGTAEGAPAHLNAELRVLERYGCDLHRLDAREPLDVDTLLCFVWPDQHERLERLRTALEIAREHPPEVVECDGIAWAREAALPSQGAATVLLHAVITEHMTADTRARLRQTIDDLAVRAAPAAPFAWVRMEPAERGYDTLVTFWPGERESRIARSDGHAQNLRWVAA